MNDGVINLLKFAPKETYIDDLMDGRQIGTVRHDCFERLLNRETDSGNSIYLNGPIFNGPNSTPNL